MSTPVKPEPTSQVEPPTPVEPSSPGGLDQVNKKALEVMKNEGPDAAADHMMTMAGGDYSRMRMMYG